ncbi:MAG: hypothetical protein ACK6DO_11125, partial [Planctomycetia bacterium]
MERRYIQFALISFAILLGTQALQAYLFPRPARQPADGTKQAAPAAPGQDAATAPGAAASEQAATATV